MQVFFFKSYINVNYVCSPNHATSAYDHTERSKINLAIENFFKPNPMFYRKRTLQENVLAFFKLCPHKLQQKSQGILFLAKLSSVAMIF